MAYRAADRERGRVRASAPTRIDLAGGTLDIWPLSVIVPGAVTVNLAIELRAHAEVTALSADRIEIVSRDRKRRVSRRLPLGERDFSGPLSLLLRLVHEFRPGRGVRLTTRAEAPAGAGLGGSSSLAVAVAAALSRSAGRPQGGAALVRRVVDLEARELRVPTGNQDHLAARHGGLAAYHHEPNGPRRERLPIPRGLEHRLVLVYTQQPRRSGFSNWEMFRNFIEGRSGAVRRMEAIARVATELAQSLRAGDLDEAGRLVGEEGRLRYGLGRSVATAKMLRVDAAARSAGALGVKVCGAGGGGCMVALTGQGRREAVARAMVRAGARLLPARIARRGLGYS